MSKKLNNKEKSWFWPAPDQLTFPVFLFIYIKITIKLPGSDELEIKMKG